MQLQQRKVFQAVPTPFRNEPKAEKLVRLPPVESRENSIIDEDNSVLDFSSGNAEVKESTVSKVNETDPNEGERGFSTLQEATMFAGLEGEIRMPTCAQLFREIKSRHFSRFLIFINKICRCV